LKKPLNKQD